MISKARLKFLRSLHRRKIRAQENLLLLEGANLVEEAVRAGSALELLLSEEAASTPRGQALLTAGLPVSVVEERTLAALAQTNTPPGFLALGESPCATLDAETLPPESLVLVAAGVGDPGNLGTLIRSAAALGAGAVVVTAGSVEATNPKAVRATAGALYRIPVRTGEVAQLKRAGFHVLVADAAGAPMASYAARPARLALVVGNEPRGVDAAVRDLADGSIAIPLARGVDSLNVAAATAILLHALAALPVRAP